MKVLENFATSRLQVAYPTREVGQASPDQELLSCLVNSVEAFVADAASDEIKCGRLLAGHGGLRPGLNMPNIHLVQDKAHASRRNLSRGWTADPHLAKIADAFVMGHQSPAKLIEYSKSFSGIFQQRIQQLEQSLQACKAHPRMQDLSYAPHRFDSCTRPFGRAVLFLHPLLLTMVQITEDRKGNEEASAAARFLDWVTPELCLQMAMMADAAEENLQMTRFFDVENFALEDLSFVISSFQDRLDALFTGDVPGTPNAKIAGCLTVPTGYTSHMLKLLSHPFMLRGRSFGKEAGVPAAAVRRCLGRMCNWFLVVKETLAAEFPNFETIQCFGVFRCVPSGTLRKSAPDSLEAAGLLAKLHAVYKMQVPLQSLQDEYYKSRHVAERLATHESLDSGLIRFWAVCASTSGVEQSFSQAKSIHESLSDHHLNDILDILDIPDSNLATVVARACALWSETYGQPRASGKGKRTVRVDSGSCRIKTPSGGTGPATSERQWLRKRRHDVSEAVGAVSSSSSGRFDLGVDLWHQ
ncbi:hypothetical protein AK812_SmicGene47234, partial [Symbiodinium microadriaticum]